MNGHVPRPRFRFTLRIIHLTQPVSQSNGNHPVQPASESKAPQTPANLNPLQDHEPAHGHAHGDKNHGHSHHGHHHSEESLKALVNRLSRIEGHIRGVKSMIQEGRACPDVLIQIAAVKGGLDRVARLILDEHLTQCVARAAEAGNIEGEIAELKAALDRFLD